MKILNDIYLVGGGIYGIGLSSKMDCNVYLIDCGSEALLIDSGVGINTEKIVRNIEKIKKDYNLNSDIRKLLLTHAHLDHSGGSANLKKLLGVKLFVSEVESKYIDDGDEEKIGLIKAKQSGVYPKSYKLTPAKVDYRLKDGEEISVGKYIIKIISTPGHSRGSVCFLLKNHEKKVLFSGDVIFIGGYIGLQNLPDSSLTEYKTGVDKLKGLAIDSLFPSHYGFTISYGQYHIDCAIEGLSGIGIPKLL